MSYPANSIAARINKPLEYISLAVTLAGLAMSSSEVLMIGMSILACVYFMRAFVPLQLEESEEQRGFLELFATAIVPKVSMIACAVALIGILFTTLHLHGGGEQTLVGISVLSITTILAVTFLLKDRDRYGFYGGFLLRMIPILFIGVYLITKTPA